jgi:3-methyladenine DNA glycosylase AlkD
MQLDFISKISAELAQLADEGTIHNSQSFFKERVTYHGVRTALVNQAARRFYLDIKHLSKDEILDLAEELLKTDYNEEAYIAFDWAYRLRDQYQPGDFIRFENWLQNYVNNWAKCDTMCNHAVGAFIERYPEYLPNLKLWATSENRWLRRASAVSLILPARKGSFLQDVFAIADRLLLDQDDLVQKGYGWLLKEASKLHQQEVYAYVVAHKTTMPRTALRYAIEKMPADLKQKAMAKPDPEKQHKHNHQS